MKTNKNDKLHQWVKSKDIMFIVTIPLIIGVLLRASRFAFDIPDTRVNNLFLEGLSLFIIGLSPLVILIRKEFPFRIFLKVVSIEGDVAVIVGWIGLILCWVPALGTFLVMLEEIFF